MLRQYRIRTQRNSAIRAAKWAAFALLDLFAVALLLAGAALLMTVVVEFVRIVVK